MPPSIKIQMDMFDLLKADNELNAVISGCAYDWVPEDASFPYVSFGPMELIRDTGGVTIYQQLDIWSRASGRAECSRVSDLVTNAILRGNRNVIIPTAEIVHKGTIILTDPDGLTSHGIVKLAAFVEQV